MSIGVAEGGYKEFGTDVVVERKAAAVGKLVVVGRESDFADKILHHLYRFGATSIEFSCGSRDLIEKAFGKKIVGTLHHRYQNLLDAVGADEQQFGIAGDDAFVDVTLNRDTGFGQYFLKLDDEMIFAAIEQRIEGDGVVVPTPAPPH